MITLGLVANVDTDGVYVTMPGSRGLLRGPYLTLQDVAVGDRVLTVTTDDGETVIVGLASAAAPRSTPASSTDNAVARFDGTGGALQTSGVTIDDDNRVVIPGTHPGLRVGDGSTNATIQVSGAAGSFSSLQFLQNGLARWTLRRSGDTESGSNAGSNLELLRYGDTETPLSTLTINRATGKITLPDVGSTAGLEFGSSGPRMMVGTGDPHGITAPVGSTWRQTDANTSHGSLKGLLWTKFGTGSDRDVDWLVDYEGRWVAYTPTVSGWTKGSSTAYGRYTRQGKTAHCNVRLVVNTGGGFAVGAYLYMSLPSTSASAGSSSGRAYLLDAGSNSFVGEFRVSPSSSTVSIATTNVGGGPYGYGAPFSSTIPFIWATNDEVEANFTYEIA